MPPKRRVRAALATASVGLLSVFALACSRGSSVPRTFQGKTPAASSAALPLGPTSVIPGERLSFRISMLGFSAGELVMAAGNPGRLQGRNVIIFRSRAVSTGVVALFKTVTDEVTTWIDLEAGSPLYHRTDTTVGSKKTEGVEIRFSAGVFDVLEWENSAKTTEQQRLPNNESAYDLTSAMMALRTWQPEPGTRASFYVLRSTRFWHTQVEFAGSHSVKTSLGRFAAVRVDGVSSRVLRNGAREPGKESRYFSMWFTDDSQHLPLLIAAKTDLGDIRMELVDYQGGGRELASNK